jgi:hypothetical protein
MGFNPLHLRVQGGRDTHRAHGRRVDREDPA